LGELLKEHLVELTRGQKKALANAWSEKEVNRCMSFQLSTFCQSELYQELQKEKADFTYGEGAL
jgi:hypothetical protein